MGPLGYSLGQEVDVEAPAEVLQEATSAGQLQGAQTGAGRHSARG